MTSAARAGRDISTRRYRRVAGSEHRSARLLFLGQKDYQQLVLIERMIADLRMVWRSAWARPFASRRARDSSRNRYLDAAERRQATGAGKGVGARARAIARRRARFLALVADARSELELEGFSPTTWRSDDKAIWLRTGPERYEQRIVLGAARLGRRRA